MVSAIVLAAGSSKRMGSPNKLLLPFKGKPVVAHVVENLLAGGIGEVIVVLGHESDKVQAVLQQLPVAFVFNPDHLLGMTTSIQHGVERATGAGYMICLADLVLITPGEYALMAATFEERLLSFPPCIYIPTCNKAPGNPVIFSCFYRAAILRHQEPEGCKGIVQANRQHIYYGEMGSDHILRDIDNPQEYNLLLQ